MTLTCVKHAIFIVIKRELRNKIHQRASRLLLHGACIFQSLRIYHTTRLRIYHITLLRIYHTTRLRIIQHFVICDLIHRDAIRNLARQRLADHLLWRVNFIIRQRGIRNRINRVRSVLCVGP